MWYLILSLAILVGGAVWIMLGKSYDRVEICAIFVLGVGFILALLSYPTLRLTTGFWPDYSEGERQGYVTKFSRKGAIFKTWEGQIQVGTGEMAALQEPWSFSIPDELADKVKGHLGKRVRIEYTEFLMMPWRYGETTYLITSIEPLSETAQ